MKIFQPLSIKVNIKVERKENKQGIISLVFKTKQGSSENDGRSDVTDRS